MGYGKKYTQHWKEGQSTSSAGVQLTNESISKYVTTDAARKKPFSQMGAQKVQPKHHGKTIKAYRDYRILDDRNINDQGVDADGLNMVIGKWYAWNAAGTRTEHATKAAALGVTNVQRIWKGDGNLYGSSRDFTTQKGGFPVLGEEGGVVNVVGTHRAVIEANIQRYGFIVRYTQAALDLDTDSGLLLREINKVSAAYATIREDILRMDLIEAGLVNAVQAGSATSMGTIDETSLVTMQTLRNMKTTLDLAECPYDTTLVKGSTKIDTVTIPSARYAYIPQEVENGLKDMVHMGKTVFEDVSEYADGAGLTEGDYEGPRNIAEGEIGRVDSTRFIKVFGMPMFEGAGADATDGADNDGDGIEDAGADFYVTDGRYDVFPILFLGSGSFETYSLKGNVARVKHSPPVASDTDPHGDIGTIAISWYQGTLLMRPEWIRVVLASAKR